MNIVVDANIIIATLITDGKTRELFFQSNLNKFAPELLKEEIVKHSQLIEKKAHISTEKLKQAIEVLFEQIHIISNTDLEIHAPQAKILCQDPNDVPYFASALYCKCPIWTNDKRLTEQSTITILNTQQLIKIIE